MLIDFIMEKCKDFNPLRPEGVEAGKMPQVCVHHISDDHLYRVCGKDKVRTLRAQVSVFGKSWEEVRALAHEVQRILTEENNLCRDSAFEQYDEENRVFMAVARYSAQAEV